MESNEQITISSNEALNGKYEPILWFAVDNLRSLSSVDVFAAVYHIPQRQFEDEFMWHFQKTFKRCISEVRLFRATELLSEKEDSENYHGIAWEVGFARASVSSLCNLVKQFTGMRLREYHRKVRQNDKEK